MYMQYPHTNPIYIYIESYAESYTQSSRESYRMVRESCRILYRILYGILIHPPHRMLERRRHIGIPLCGVVAGALDTIKYIVGGASGVPSQAIFGCGALRISNRVILHKFNGFSSREPNRE